MSNFAGAKKITLCLQNPPPWRLSQFLASYHPLEHLFHSVQDLNLHFTFLSRQTPGMTEVGAVCVGIRIPLAEGIRGSDLLSGSCTDINGIYYADWYSTPSATRDLLRHLGHSEIFGKIAVLRDPHPSPAEPADTTPAKKRKSPASYGWDGILPDGIAVRVIVEAGGSAEQVHVSLEAHYAQRVNNLLEEARAWAKEADVQLVEGSISL